MGWQWQQQLWLQQLQLATKLLDSWFSEFNRNNPDENGRETNSNKLTSNKMADSSEEPMADGTPPSSPLPAGAQSVPALSPVASAASGADMAVEDNRVVYDAPDTIEDEGDGDDLLENIER